MMGDSKMLSSSDTTDPGDKVLPDARANTRAHPICARKHAVNPDLISGG